MFKLEVGSGRQPKEGFKTVDIESYAKPDYLGDFRTMNFENVDVLRAFHILEHFGRDEAIRVLKLWHGWLAPKGVLWIETPDFERSRNIDLWDSDRHLYGSQEAEWAFHRDGWWEEKFRKVLPEIGFEIQEVKLTKSVSHRDKDRSRVEYPNIEIIAVKNV